MKTKNIGNILKGPLAKSVLALVFGFLLLTGLSLFSVNAAMPLSIFGIACFLALILARIVFMERVFMTGLRNLKTTITNTSPPVQKKPAGEVSALRDGNGGSAIAVKRVMNNSSKPELNASKGSTPVIGRQAADITVDLQRQALLAKALGTLEVAGDLRPGQRHLAVLGSSALASLLGSEYSIHRLHPSISRAQISGKCINALIVDQSELSRGLWAGTESAIGTHLANELLWLMDYMRRENVPVFFIRCKGIPDVFTEEFIKRSTLTVDSNFNYHEWGEDLALPLMDALVEYSEKGLR